MVNVFLSGSAYFGIMISLASYVLGMFLNRKLKSPLINPLLFSEIVTILVLLACGIDYDSYNQSANILSYFLTPATICLAIPLHEQFQLLKKHYPAIAAGVLAGIVTNGVLVFALACILKMSHAEYVTFLPKSVTTGISLSLTEEYGGYVTITLISLVITGMFGNMFGEFILNKAGVKEPVARGIALGSAAHAIGTAKAAEMGEVEGAMAGLAVTITGLLTVPALILFTKLM